MTQFSDVKSFQSEQQLNQYYYKNFNDSVVAVIFEGNNLKHLNYVIRCNDQYGRRYDFLNTGQLYSNKLYQYQPHKGKL